MGISNAQPNVGVSGAMRMMSMIGGEYTTRVAWRTIILEIYEEIGAAKDTERKATTRTALMMTREKMKSALVDIAIITGIAEDGARLERLQSGMGV